MSKKKKKHQKQKFNYRKFLGKIKTCKHYRQSVAIGGRIIYASAYYDAPQLIPDDIPEPDLQVYLDPLWLEPINMPILSCGLRKRMPKPAIPTIYVPWYDNRGLPLPTLKWLITTILDEMEKGKMVEIGCGGGHGRTGTVLACLIIEAEGLDPKDAINEVRLRYCGEAVESISQVTSIYTFAGEDWLRATNEWSRLDETKSTYGGQYYAYGDGW